jgi:hypothetical protein
MPEHSETERPLMRWFAAHIVMVVELKEQKQDHFPAWENVVLVKASSEAEAFRKAEVLGGKDCSEARTRVTTMVRFAGASSRRDGASPVSGS